MSNDMLGKIMRTIVTIPSEWLGVLVDLLEKLAGSEGAKWLVALKLFLRKENPWPTFPTWRAIKLGTHENVAKLVEAIEAKGDKFSPGIRTNSVRGLFLF